MRVLERKFAWHNKANPITHNVVEPSCRGEIEYDYLSENIAMTLSCFWWWDWIAEVQRELRWAAMQQESWALILPSAERPV